MCASVSVCTHMEYCSGVEDLNIWGVEEITQTKHRRRKALIVESPEMWIYDKYIIQTHLYFHRKHNSPFAKNTRRLHHCNNTFCGKQTPVSTALGNLFKDDTILSATLFFIQRIKCLLPLHACSAFIHFFFCHPFGPMCRIKIVIAKTLS